MALTIEAPQNREITIELEGQEVRFTLAPESFENMVTAYNWAEKQGVFDPENITNMGKTSAYFKQIMDRVIEWSGFADPSGHDLPCNEETKLLVFGKYPDALMSIAKKLETDLESETKNLETSPGGMPSS